MTPYAIAVAALILAAPTARASSWHSEGGVQSRVVLTDNLFLTAGSRETGEIVQVRPFVSSSRKGNRVTARFNYGPSALWYPGRSDLNRVMHTLNAGVQMELIERYFVLEVGANANQALINPRVNSGFNALGNPNAFAQRATVTVRPRINLPVLGGRFATVRITPGLGYSYTAASADGRNGLRTPTTNSSVRVVSGSIFTTVPWSMTWRRRMFDTRTGEGVGEFLTRVGYVFNPKYRVDVSLGYDDGSSAYRGTNGKTRGARWETALQWTPHSRARFTAGVGERYFGSTYRFEGFYRHKHWAFRSSYRVSIENAATALQQQQVVPMQDVFGKTIRNPFTRGEVLTTSVTTPALTNDTFLRKLLTLESSFSKGRNAASLRWFVTRRDYDKSDVQTLDNQLQFRYSRSLSARLRASAVVNVWDHSESSDSRYDYVQDALDLVVHYEVGRRTSLGARVGRLNRDAKSASGDFSENRASLDFTLRF
ncbi:MAG: TIGR03016 family PEP-CTERM system-associated outer membrane protein [Thiohalocapsa sp.]|uniref:TIGR03016 family PEP-CTERM system-associated outer membrane protein n=1 Tax=Thiohalocapsa sp. TaxID=2497641 RepID=UPI0025D941CE|nr:TIGR03016 family PEP-CTERM system-associated outer membrane protein [Thiohalocapsa sp.]MCG6940115.1 TIGR03016 family PEP-CTERM system-associated outer membrane protein [Thiohalocapsa sp.]